MPFPPPEPGLVISYSFLWRAEAAEGRAEGRKDRPCAIVLALMPEPAAPNAPRVWVVPVTHSPPSEPNGTLEVPAAIKRHLGLDADPSWIVLDELNTFVWPGFDLRTVPGSAGQYAYGHLPPTFFRLLISRLRARRAALTMNTTPR